MNVRKNYTKPTFIVKESIGTETRPAKKKRKIKKLRPKINKESSKIVTKDPSETNKSNFDMNWDDDTMEIKQESRRVIDDWD